MARRYIPSRGDVVWLSFSPQVGHELEDTRLWSSRRLRITARLALRCCARLPGCLRMKSSGERIMSRSASRIGAACAIAGSVLLFVGTYLHPMEADPNEAVAAFAEYAADHLWVASHLTQLVGVALMVAALLFLTQQLEVKSGLGWAQIATGGAIASLAVATVLQAVDGIALKRMVDIWAAAPALQKEGAFHAAFAVRQIEIGLASMLSLSMGLTVILYGVALLVDNTYPKVVGGLAILGGVPTMVAGVVMAYTGFSELAMAINMPASSLLLVWMLILGGCMWRQGGMEKAKHASPLPRAHAHSDTHGSG